MRAQRLSDTNEKTLAKNCTCITRMPFETHKHENVNVNKCCWDAVVAKVIDQINSHGGGVIPVIWCAVISACLCSAEIAT